MGLDVYLVKCKKDENIRKCVDIKNELKYPPGSRMDESEVEFFNMPGNEKFKDHMVALSEDYFDLRAEAERSHPCFIFNWRKSHEIHELFVEKVLGEKTENCNRQFFRVKERDLKTFLKHINIEFEMHLTKALDECADCSPDDTQAFLKDFESYLIQRCDQHYNNYLKGENESVELDDIGHNSDKLFETLIKSDLAIDIMNTKALLERLLREFDFESEKLYYYAYN